MKTLLAVHEIDQPIEALSAVVELARASSAHLNVVVLGLVHTVPVTAAPGVPAYYYDEPNADLLKAGKKRVEEVEAVLQKENLSASVTLECRDVALVEHTVLKHALFSDATLFASRSVLSSDLQTRAFNGALLSSGRPVIIMGSKGGSVADAKKVMVAWNGEPQSAKAVHQSLAWIDDATDAHVVVVDPDEFSLGPNPGDDIAAYLARQNLAVTVDRVASGNRDIADVLLEHANDIDADMIIMGAYSHSRFREWLLGGTTRDILLKAELPVLMAH